MNANQKKLAKVWAKYYANGHDPKKPFAVADAMKEAADAGLTDEQLSEAMDAGLVASHRVKSAGEKRGAHRYVAAKSRLRKKLGREPTTGEMGKDVYRRMTKRSPK